MACAANWLLKGLTILPNAAFLGLGVLMLGACGGDAGSGGTNSSVPPPIVTPPRWTPFVVVDVINAPEGQVVPLHGGSLPIQSSTTVTLDGRAVPLSELGHGDVAVIRGSRRGDYDGGHPNFIWETIDSIDAYHLVVGAVDSVDASHARLVVMGQQVTVTGDTDVFDRPAAEGALAEARPGAMVTVSGFLTASGEIIATRIARADSPVEFLLRGLVTATDTAAGRLRIGGIDVDYTAATIDPVGFGDGRPAAGDQVIALATAGPVDGLLHASSVTSVPRSLPVDADTAVALSGMVTRFASTEDFDVAGVTVRLDCFGVDCSGMPYHIAVDAAVQLTGAQTTEGVVSAWHLSPLPAGLQSRFPFGDATVIAPLTAIDAGTGVLSVPGFQVQTFAHTRFLGRSDGGQSVLSAGDLQVGDVISAAGTYGGIPGLLIAASIARLPQQDPQVIAQRFERAEPEIIVLGRPILTSAATRWDNCGNPTDASRLFGGDVYIYYVTVGLPALAADPLEAAWVSIYDDYC